MGKARTKPLGFNLRDHTHLLVVAGSRSLNLHNEHSDVDVLGCVVPPKRFFFGAYTTIAKAGRFEQADCTGDMDEFVVDLTPEEQRVSAEVKLEGTVYALNKLCYLLAEANPTILGTVFCRDQEVRVITPVGSRLREQRDLFLSRKVRPTFAGYAFEQLARIDLHKRWLFDPPQKPPTREEFGLFPGMEDQKTQKRVKAAMAMIDKVVDTWELDLSQLEAATRVRVREGITTFLAEVQIAADEKWMAAGRTLGVSDNFMVLLNKERAYKKARGDWKKYQAWLQNRNPTRAALEAKHGYDVKHGAHLFRSLIQAEEVLTTGEVNVWREDRERILEVLDGGKSYEDLVSWARDQNDKLIELEKTSPLPAEVDQGKVEDLCVELTEMALDLQS